MSTCALCRHDRQLCRSHILPEFLYKPTYDEKHRHIYLDADEGWQAQRVSGFWDELLCEECEGRLNKWESYFADVWFANPRRPRVIPSGHFAVTGLDYSRFKLFHLSILWRASVARFEAYRDVRLGPHEERIRRRLLAQDPGTPDVYPMMGVALRDPETSGFVDSILSVPASAKVSGHSIYRAYFGGVAWYYAVSSHRGGCPVSPTLEVDGALTLLSEDWTKHHAIAELAAQIARMGTGNGNPAA